MRLEVRSFDDRLEARVGHGSECVALTLYEIDSTARYGLRGVGGIVLTPDEADALGLRLRQQAKASKARP